MINFEEAEYIFKNLAYKEKSYAILCKEFKTDKANLCEQMSMYKKIFGLRNEEHYCAYTYLRYKYKDEIISQYLQERKPMYKIIKDYGFSDENIIRKILQYYDIPIHQRGYTSKTNQELFKEIKTEIEAYTLGLITADGSVNKESSVYIHLTESDKYLLEKINQQLLNNTGHILISPKKIGKPVARLSFCGKQICQNLSLYNVVPDKSHLLKELFIFPEPLMQHYLRGLYDGDGVCSYNRPYLRIGYCAYNQDFVQHFQDFFVKKLEVAKNKLFNTGSCWHCSWGSKQDIQKIATYLYKDSTIFLSRKKDKIYNYLYDNTEVIS